MIVIYKPLQTAFGYGTQLRVPLSLRFLLVCFGLRPKYSETTPVAGSRLTHGLILMVGFLQLILA